MRDEYGIRKCEAGASPFSVSDWTKDDAVAAAKYNAERWGPYEVVARSVTEWEVC